MAQDGYKWLAIQLDGGHPPDKAGADDLRDTEIAVHGYEVRRLRPEAKGYLEEVRSLLEEIETAMLQAESDPWSVAVPLRVTKTEPSSSGPPEEDVPF